MKRIILILAAVVLLGGCEPGMRRYRNDELSFSLLVPGDWQVSEGEMGTVLLAKEKRHGRADMFQENINVVVKTFTKPMSHTLYLDLNREAIIQALPGVKENMRQEEIATPAGEGRCLVFDNTFENVKMRTQTCSWMKENSVYVITAICEEGKAEAYVPVFNKVFKSLRIK